MRLLHEIIAKRRVSVEEQKARTGLDPIMQAAFEATFPIRSLRSAISTPGISLIAEVKGVSPSRGTIRKTFTVPDIVRSYERGGASAISVLTEPEYFGGSFKRLLDTRKTSHLPILCKDFVIDPYLLYQARFMGADAVLLIAAILDDLDLDLMIEIAHEVGLEVLLEATSVEELNRCIASRADLIGINNRNLRTLEVDLNLSFELYPLVKNDGRPVVVESGIHTRDDVARLESAGFDGVLVGTALMESTEPEGKIRELLGR